MKNRFFSTILGCTRNVNYKHYNEYIRQKFVSLSTTKKIHSECDVTDGSISSGLRQPILFSFVQHKPAGYKVLCEPETIY